MARIAAMIMAAGQSSRFGGCKHLALYQNKPIVQHAIDKVSLAAEHIYVITGAWHKEIRTAQQQGQISGAMLIYNPAWQQGLGHSIATGVRQLQQHYDAILILLADQIALTSSHIQSLLVQQANADIVCSHYYDKPGVPALFNSNCFEQLKTLQGDQGAKALLKSDQWKRIDITMPQAQTDIDTPEQLQQYAQFCAE